MPLQPHVPIRDRDNLNIISSRSSGRHEVRVVTSIDSESLTPSRSFTLSQQSPGLRNKPLPSMPAPRSSQEPSRKSISRSPETSSTSKRIPSVKASHSHLKPLLLSQSHPSFSDIEEGVIHTAVRTKKSHTSELSTSTIRPGSGSTGSVTLKSVSDSSKPLSRLREPSNLNDKSQSTTSPRIQQDHSRVQSQPASTGRRDANSLSKKSENEKSHQLPLGGSNIPHSSPAQRQTVVFPSSPLSSLPSRQLSTTIVSPASKRRPSTSTSGSSSTKTPKSPTSASTVVSSPASSLHPSPTPATKIRSISTSSPIKSRISDGNRSVSLPQTVQTPSKTSPSYIHIPSPISLQNHHQRTQSQTSLKHMASSLSLQHQASASSIHLTSNTPPRLTNSPSMLTLADMKQMLSKPASASVTSSGNSDNEAIPRLRRQSSDEGYRGSPSGLGRGLSVDIPKREKSAEKDRERERHRLGLVNELGPTSPHSKDSTQETGKKPRNVLKRKGSSGSRIGLVALRVPPSSSPKSRSPSRSPVPSSHSSRLTPAGEVVMAYKQKELLRSQHDSPSPPLLSEGAPAEHSPYYTIFGSTSSTGRVVAVGSPLDNTLDLGESSAPGSDSWATVSVGATRPKSMTVKSLSRKISTRWKTVDEKEKGKEKERDRIERRSSELLGKSVDRASPEQSASKPQSTPVEPVNFSEPEPTSVPLLKTPRSRKPEPLGSGGGGMLWRLMKRLSTGGLRDKYMSESTPPPVPEVPVHLKSGPTSNDGHSSPHGGYKSFMASRPSVSGVSQPLPRPPPISFVTRSPSPISSSDKSSNMFHRPQSPRSSESSYGDEMQPPPSPPPPMPSLEIQKHTIGQRSNGPEPSELGRRDTTIPMKNENDVVNRRSRLKSRSFRVEKSDRTVTQTSVDIPRPHPSPKRRPVTSPIRAVSTSALFPHDHDKNTRTPSPTIPEFSTAHPINTFVPRKSTSSNSSPVQVTSVAPPRPLKSPKRMSIVTTQPILAALRSTNIPGSPSTPTVSAQPRTPRTPVRPRTEAEWDDILFSGKTIHLSSDQALASDELSVRNSVATTVSVETVTG